MLEFMVSLFLSGIDRTTSLTLNSRWPLTEKMDEKEQKHHRKKHSGPKADKKKKRHLKDLGLEDEEDARKRNPKAFAVQSAVRMARTFHRYSTPGSYIIYNDRPINTHFILFFIATFLDFAC